MIYFGEPYYLFGLFLIPLLVLFYRWSWKRRESALARFGNPELVKKLVSSVDYKRRIQKIGLTIIGITFLILGLARPQWGVVEKDVKRLGTDIIIALDTSKSMLAEDFAPNRLEKAKQEIRNLLGKLQGDRIGLVAFAGTSFVQCPLTLDYTAAELFLDEIDSEIIPVPGTAIGEAIKTAKDAFVQEEQKYKVLILVTDGEDHGGDPVKAAEEAAKSGIKIFTIGIGTREGEPVPEFNEKGEKVGYKKDRNGNSVFSKLDDLTLQKISLETDGKYYQATTGELELESIYDYIKNMEQKELRSQMFTFHEDRYQWFIGIGLFFLLLELFVSDRMKYQKEWKGRFQ